jgi:hypothetical protein
MAAAAAAAAVFVRGVGLWLVSSLCCCMDKHGMFKPHCNAVHLCTVSVAPTGIAAVHNK